MRRAVRILIVSALALAALAVLWGWVFPWADDAFVNRPQIGLSGLAGAMAAVLTRSG